jgi:hypothetical protein
MPDGPVVLHHGAFFKLVPNGVCMIGTSCLKKVPAMVGWLPHLAFEIVLSSGGEVLIRVDNVLVIVTLVLVGSHHDLLGLSLQPPHDAFGAPLCALAGCLGWHLSTTAKGRFLVILNENGPDHLLTRGMPGGNVEKLIHGLWLVMAELMHQGSIVHARLEC